MILSYGYKYNKNSSIHVKLKLSTRNTIYLRNNSIIQSLKVLAAMFFKVIISCVIIFLLFIGVSGAGGMF